MTKRPTRSLSTLLRLLSRPVLLFYALPYLMVLLVGGTLAQKYIGLYAATQQVFNSFILWIGFLPLPGGAMVIGLILLNLCCYFITKAQWSKEKWGTSLSHLGVILLLVGGAVTLFTKQEGFIILRHGQTASQSFDYHDREFIVEKDGVAIVTRMFSEIKKNQTIPLPQGDRILFRAVFANSGFGEDHRLRALPEKPEDETNQAGMIVIIGKKAYALAEFSSQSVTHEDYRLTLRRVSYDLPFTLGLRSLQQSMYPGQMAAKDYETRFTVTENDRSWKSRVAMNEPWRYRGYTFYQASVLTLPDGEIASVLNVVKNNGWFFPYLSTALIVIGLSAHVWRRRHAKR